MADFKAYRLQFDEPPSSSYQGKSVADPPGLIPRAQREAVRGVGGQEHAQNMTTQKTNPTQALTVYAREVRSKDGNVALRQQVWGENNSINRTSGSDQHPHLSGTLLASHGCHQKRGLYVFHPIHVWIRLAFVFHHVDCVRHLPAIAQHAHGRQGLST